MAQVRVNVLEIIDTKKVNLVKLPYKFEVRRDGDSAWVIADNKLALDKLDWSPKEP